MINIPVIRYADVILMAAEAALESGDNTKALEYLNMIRTRARLSGTSGVPADLSSITHADIEHERVVELALEGHRFFDLVRWGIVAECLDGLYRKSHDRTVDFEDGVDEFFPMPDFIRSANVDNIELSQMHVEIFPNPVSQSLNIRSDKMIDRIMVSDTQGRMFLDERPDDTHISINLSDLQPGFYFLTLKTSSGQQTTKIVKQ